MKKILFLQSDEDESIEMLKKRFRVRRLDKGIFEKDFDACIIDIDRLNLSSVVTAFWLKIYQNTFRSLGMILIFWSWSDELREDIDSIGKNVFFVKKDCDEDHLLLAATDLLK